ncbi:MAG: glycoside hydrolase family 3 protein, partial [Draconibacterium sp.]|nr:glycoside hydrolase family 3 protein [Draconibacterium sp.]
MKPTLKIIFILTILTLSFNLVCAQKPEFLQYKNDEWVNKQMDSLTLEEKIAQLMMITVYPNQNTSSKNAVLEKIRSYKPGGILVMQGEPVKTASWVNQFQEASETPLLVAIDGEWGPAMRIKNTIVYPCAQTLGAIQDTTYIYQMGRDYAYQLKLLGINMNFAPVADINTNPANPVIGFRSFGEDKNNVAEKAWMVAKGMQDAGIVSVAKHFPGHGDTKTDSHYALPLITHDKKRIDNIESYPFRYLSNRGIAGIMTAHLNVPSLDESGKTSSLSKKVVTDYLKNEIGFQGLIITDAINMKGVKADRNQAELEAIRAGNDMVEFVRDIEKAIGTIKEAVLNNQILEEEINEKCRTVLALKRWVGLNEYKPANLENLVAKLNS